MPLVSRNGREARFFGDHLAPGNEESVNWNGLFQAVFDQGESLRPIIPPFVTPFIMMLSIDRSCDQRARKKSVYVNRVNIGEHDSGFPFEQSGEISLGGKLGRGTAGIPK